MLRGLFLGLLVLAGASCGGGGGGGGGGSNPPPQFPSSQANLTSANAQSYATSVDLAARMAATLRLGQFLTSTATLGTLTDPGCRAIGAGAATINVTPPTGSVTGTASYSNFDQCFGIRLTGTANVNGTLVGTQVDSLNLTFSNVTFTTTGGGPSYQMSGSASLQYMSGGSGSSSYVMTVNATVSGGASFKLDGFRIDSAFAAGLENLFISGRLTLADGFVDITPTASRVELPIPSAGLQNGTVQLTGATTIATAFFNGGTVPPSIISIVPR